MRPVLVKQTCIHFRWITTGEYAGAHSRGGSGTFVSSFTPRLGAQWGGSRQSTQVAYLEEVRKLVVCLPAWCSARLQNAHLFLSLIIHWFSTLVNTQIQSGGTPGRSIKRQKKPVSLRNQIQLQSYCLLQQGCGSVGAEYSSIQFILSSTHLHKLTDPSTSVILHNPKIHTYAHVNAQTHTKSYKNKPTDGHVHVWIL